MREQQYSEYNLKCRCIGIFNRAIACAVQILTKDKSQDNELPAGAYRSAVGSCKGTTEICMNDMDACTLISNSYVYFWTDKNHSWSKKENLKIDFTYMNQNFDQGSKVLVAENYSTASAR